VTHLVNKREWRDRYIFEAVVYTGWLAAHDVIDLYNLEFLLLLFESGQIKAISVSEEHLQRFE
jgi:hypothetical protein